MVWNTMILSQYVIVSRITGLMPADAERRAMIRHYTVTATPEGGWGLHPASGPSTYCTTLAYVALRLLGSAPGEPLCARAAAWLRTRPGGVAAIATWGKFWLALLGLYDYRGVNPAPPEVFLLPRWAPLHPDRLYCHTRSIHQAMAYLHGTRFRAELGPLGRRLRQELFGTDTAPRSTAVSGPDIHVPPGRLLRCLYALTRAYERRPVQRLRRRALERCLHRVEHEQHVTGGPCLSPVNGLLNVLVLHHRQPGSAAVARALDAQSYWRWNDEQEGTRFAGARSHTWDTSFAVEALLADDSRLRDAGAAALLRAASFLQGAQITEEIPDRAVTARSPALGGWCFSEGGHRWPVSDCTAEAVAALLHARPRLPSARRCTDEAVRRAVAFLLDRQNPDGGFGSYEARRGARRLEALNPAEMFTRCVVEDSYVECTASALLALSAVDRDDPALPEGALARVRSRATAFLLRGQLPDGSWPAAWGINRIYGTWFAVRGLRAAGTPRTHPALRRAAHWLRSAQRADGGWGEHHRGCTENRYAEADESQPVSTAWALLALMDLTAPDDPAVLRGVRWLCSHQKPDGTWTPAKVNGVFFGTGMLDYRLYVRYFPLWALGRHLRRVPQQQAHERPAPQ
ncbi:prenyltransferase/squalene oxidase repeat-containing protein [Streptomyces sp. NPDC046215]|uniref:Squalene--hopene cyclase n=1 Tax=Streptomyces stramineus TaxID=173861 RepID=A0ABN0ZAT2_9ACTN